MTAAGQPPAASPTAAPTAAVIPVGPALGTWVTAWLVGGLLLGPIAIVLAGGEVGDDLGIGPLTAAALASWVAFTAALMWVSRRFGSGDALADVALRARPIDLVGIPVGVVAQLVLIPLLYVPLQALWPDTFADERLEERAQELADRASGATTWLLLLVVVVGAPLVEEAVYRGLLQRSVTRAIGPVGGLVLVSALFALVHLAPIEYPGLMLAGAVFGGTVLVTDRIGPAIVAHAAFNATGLAYVL